jgi:hypothetical protein
LNAARTTVAFFLFLALTACGSPQRVASAPRIKVFAAQPVALTERAREVALSWEVEGRTTELLLEPGVGRVTGSSVRVAPTTTTTYTLTATNDAGSRSATTTVAVPAKPNDAASPLAGPWVFEIVGDAGTTFSGEFLATEPRTFRGTPGLWGPVSECLGAAACADSQLAGVLHDPGSDRFQVALTPTDPTQAELTPTFLGADSDAQLAENTPRHLLLEGRGRLADGETASFRVYQLGK